MVRTRHFGFPEAAHAVAAILGISDHQIFFQVDQGCVFVSWHESLRCSQPQWEAVTRAVRTNVPVQYRGLNVVIT